MGFLNKSKPGRPELRRLPTGTFTVDADGRIVSSTVPHWVPDAQIKEIGRQILAVFNGARTANLQFSEMIVQYAAFKITAREMRGGAIVFLVPRALQSVALS
ncbi:MAG TPA: hypothetical protein VFC44_19625 [Candidatus Saccharimonadales bacterium]|nr:hypothetical protein [Candidatus Saccharimonadales bacterium]